MSDKLVRRASVEPAARTPMRDTTAEWIATAIVDEERLPMTYTEIAEASADADGGPWSRQHIANTIQAYFWEDDAAELAEQASDGGVNDQAIKEAYRNGYRDGYHDAMTDKDADQ